MSKRYFKKLDTKKYNELRKVELKSVDVLERLTQDIKSILSDGAAFANKNDKLVDELENSLEKGSKLRNEIKALNLNSLGNRIESANDDFISMQIDLDAQLENMRDALTAFAKNAEALGLKADDVQAYATAKKLLAETSLERFGDDYGYIGVGMFQLMDNEYIELKNI